VIELAGRRSVDLHQRPDVEPLWSRGVLRPQTQRRRKRTTFALRDRDPARTLELVGTQMPRLMKTHVECGDDTSIRRTLHAADAAEPTDQALRERLRIAAHLFVTDVRSLLVERLFVIRGHVFA